MSLAKSLFEAVEQKQVQQAISLIRDGANVNYGEESATKISVLMVATQYDLAEVVQLLLEKGARINHADTRGRTALFYACQYNAFTSARLLVSYGANLDIFAGNGLTALMFASYFNANAIVSYLITKGANVDLRDNGKFNVTPIFYAVGQGHREVFFTLIRAGANLNLKDSSGRNLLEWAQVATQMYTLIRQLQSSDPRKDNWFLRKFLSFRLRKFSAVDLPHRLSELFDTDTNVYATGPAGSPGSYSKPKAMVYSYSYPNLEVIERFPAGPLYIAFKMRGTFTPNFYPTSDSEVEMKAFFNLIRNKPGEMISYLCEQKVDLNTYINDSNMAVLACCIKSFPEEAPRVVKFLLDERLNVDVNQKDIYEWSGLMYACRENQREVVNLFARRSSIINPNDLSRCLQIAVDYEHNELIKVLIECGAKVSGPGLDMTAFDVAENVSNVKALQQPSVASGGSVNEGYAQTTRNQTYQGMEAAAESNNHQANRDGIIPSTDQFVIEQKASENVYNFNTENSRGFTLVFNVTKDREGALVDSKKIQELFSTFGYEVKVYENRSKIEMLTILEGLRKNSCFMKHDSIVIFLMGHGSKGVVHDGHGEKINYETDVFESFNDTRFPHLKGKPKLFFISSCRQDGLANGEEGVYDASNRARSNSEASILSFATRERNDSILRTTRHSDRLISFATSSGEVAWRDKITGTRYIGAIYKVFSEHAHDQDILALLTTVNAEVHRGGGTWYNSKEKKKEGTELQCADMRSTLKKKFFFFPRANRK